MLTFEMLWAVLQGLPSVHLDDHLGREWIRLSTRIQEALAKGHEPISALISAIQQAEYWQIWRMQESLKKVKPVMDLPGLSYRQKEALIALRVAGVASLAQLSRILMQDRSHTHKRLAVLVQRGLAIKFFRPDGVYYFAVPGRLDRSIRSAAHQIITDLMELLVAKPTGAIHSLAKFAATGPENRHPAEPGRSSNALPSTEGAPTQPATSATLATNATLATPAKLHNRDP